MHEAPHLGTQILGTKLVVPAAPHALIARPRLTALLDAALQRKLTLVSAPAGFGKTTLIAEWLRQSPLIAHPLLAATPESTTSSPLYHAAWVSLSEMDNQPVRFWTHVFAALDLCQPGLCRPLLSHLAAQQAPPLDYLLTLFINTLVSTSQQLILVLDDYHLIRDPAIHHSLTLLLDHLPPQLHLVLTVRTDPPLPLPRLRGRAEALEIRTDQLRCTPGEVQAFAAETMQLTLPPDVVQEMAARTEGWLVGLQLLGLSLQGRDDPAGLLHELHGSHAYILDYLTDEVLRRQPAEIQTFLLHTSILDRLSAAVCDAVMQQGGSGRLLEELERANLFVTALDEQRRWYRYHQLFAEALRHRLGYQDPELLRTLHRRAGQWYAEHDQIDSALEHTLLAHDWSRAAEMIERAARMSLFREAERLTVQQWLHRLPDAIVRTHPRLCLVQARMMILANQPVAARHWLDAASAALAVAPARLDDLAQRALRDHDRQRMLAEHAARRAFIAAVFDEDSATALQLSWQAAEHLTEDDIFERALIPFAAAPAYLARGEVVPAIEHMLQASSLIQTAHNSGAAIINLSEAATFMQLRGRLHAARRAFEQAIQLGMRPDGLLHTSVGIAYAYYADLLREWNQLDEALDIALQGIALGKQIGYSLYLDGAYLVLARIYRARQAWDDAEDALRQVLGPPDRTPNRYLHPWLIEAEQIRLALARGNLAQAEQWIEAHARPSPPAAPFARQQVETLRARLLLARRKPAAVLQLVPDLRAAALATERYGAAIELWLLQALAYAQCREGARAHAALEEALRLAEPEGFVRIFVDEGPALAALLSQHRLTATGAAGRYIDMLLAAMAGQPAVSSAARIADVPRLRPLAPVAQPLVEPLSERELEVLQLLARGASNQDIAHELVIALNTVKRHVSNIIAKLGVANRTQATVEARTLGLIREEL